MAPPRLAPHQAHTALPLLPPPSADFVGIHLLQSFGLEEEKICVRRPDFLLRLKGGGGGSRASARLTVGAAASPTSGLSLSTTQHIFDALRDNLRSKSKPLRKIRRKVIRHPRDPLDTADALT